MNESLRNAIIATLFVLFMFFVGYIMGTGV